MQTSRGKRKTSGGGDKAPKTLRVKEESIEAIGKSFPNSKIFTDILQLDERFSSIDSFLLNLTNHSKHFKTHVFPGKALWQNMDQLINTWPQSLQARTVR